MSRLHFATAQKANGYMAHIAHDKSLIDKVQDKKDINDVYDTRRNNLRSLIEQWNGPKALGLKLGYKNASFLVQMAGPNPTREITEATARKIESILDLPAGWMDQQHESLGPVPVDHTLISRVIKAVVQTAEDMAAVMKPTQLGDVVSLVYDDADEHGGHIRDEFVRRIVQLLK
jgi:hypothetical protein